MQIWASIYSQDCMQRRRVEFDKEIRRCILLKLWALMKITAGWHGKLGRDRAKAAHVIHAQQWKAMFSSVEQMILLQTGHRRDTRQPTANRPL
jgi:hypothetical protein